MEKLSKNEVTNEDEIVNDTDTSASLETSIKDILGWYKWIINFTVMKCLIINNTKGDGFYPACGTQTQIRSVVPPLF